MNFKKRIQQYIQVLLAYVLINIWINNSHFNIIYFSQYSLALYSPLLKHSRVSLNLKISSHGRDIQLSPPLDYECLGRVNSLVLPMFSRVLDN